MDLHEYPLDIGQWVEGTNMLIENSVLEDIDLPGFAKTIKHKFIKARFLKSPRYPTRIVEKTYKVYLNI